MVDFSNRIVISPFPAGRIKPVDGRNKNMERRKFKKRLKKNNKTGRSGNNASDSSVIVNDDKKELTGIVNDTSNRIIDIKI